MFFAKYKKRIFDIIAYFGASLVPMLMNILINPLISLNMDPEDFAIVGYFTSFNALITPLISFYFIQFYIKRYFELELNERLKLKAMIFKALIWFSFGVAVLSAAGILSYIKFLNEEFSLPVFPYLFISVATLPFTGIYSLELADFKMKRESHVYFRISFFYGLLIVILNLLYVVVMKQGALGKMLAPLCTNVLFFGYLLYKNSYLFSIRTSFRDFKQVFIFCLPLALGASLGYFTNGYDKTYLETLNQPIEYGYYVVGASIATYLSIFSTAISTTFQPDIYEAIAIGNTGKLYKTFFVQLLLVSIVTIVFILFCPFLVKILTAGKYTLSTNYVRIMSLATISSTLYYNINCISIAKGYPRLYLLTTVIGGICIVCLMPIFVNRWTFMGGAYMTVLSFIILFGINLALLAYVLHKNKRV